jgi:hypothetical protein
MDKFVRGEKFGFVFMLDVPEEHRMYSILVEYPDGVFGANFQSWNLNFFGFYENYVMLHSKPIKLDGDNEYKHALVMANLDVDAMRKFFKAQ